MLYTGIVAGVIIAIGYAVDGFDYFKEEVEHQISEDKRDSILSEMALFYLLNIGHESEYHDEIQYLDSAINSHNLLIDSISFYNMQLLSILQGELEEIHIPYYGGIIVYETNTFDGYRLVNGFPYLVQINNTKKHFYVIERNGTYTIIK